MKNKKNKNILFCSSILLLLGGIIPPVVSCSINNSNTEQIINKSTIPIVNPSTTNVHSIDAANLAKAASKYNIGNKYNILANLQHYFAQELISIPINSQLQALSITFNNQLIDFINNHPEEIFPVNDIVNPVNNPSNFPYVKSGTSLVVEILNNNCEELMITFSKLSFSGTLIYSNYCLSIKKFNIGTTKRSTTKNLDITNYVYPINSNSTITPSNYTVDDFLYKNNGQFNPEDILKDFINSNINILFNNAFSLTKCSGKLNILDTTINNSTGIELSFKIENYVDNNGQLLFIQFNEIFKINIIGFKQKQPNKLHTTAKTNITIDTLKTQYSSKTLESGKQKYPILSNLSSYFIQQLIPGGYTCEQLTLELKEAINTDPNFWLNDIVTSSINPSKLPVVESLNIIPTSSLTVLSFQAKILSQPQFDGDVVSNSNYQNINFEISQGTSGETFGKNAEYGGNTSFRGNGANNNTVISSASYDVKKLNGSLSTFKVEQIQNMYETNKQSLVSQIENCINQNKETMFANVISSTKISVLPDDVSFNNKILSANFKLDNYFESGKLIENQQSNLFNIKFDNFGYKSHATEIAIIVVTSVISGLILISVVSIIILYFMKSKKNKIAPDKTYPDWKQ